MNDSHASLEELSNRIDDLEKRVHALEHPGDMRVAATESHYGAAAVAAQIEAADLQTGTVFPVLGRAMLGIAGAYLLRALTTARAAPGLLASAIAVVYALAWLLWALRTSQALHRYLYAATSALILAPMLWEATLHFNLLSPMMAAGILAGFATLVTVLELREDHARVAWIVQSMAAIMAASLAFATHHVLPFLFSLLIVVFVAEFARVRGYPEPAWPLMALVTDAAFWGMIFIYSGPQSARGDYADLPALSLAVAGYLLFAISGTSVAIRVTIKKCRTGVFESVQLVIVFLLATASALFFVPEHGEMVVGLACLALAAAIYPVTFIRLRQYEDARNFRVFGTWSAALLVAGTLCTMPPGAAAMLLAVAACAAYVLSTQIHSRMLELHGAVFLCTGAAMSEMPRYVFGALAGSLPGRPAISVLVISIAAASAFVVDRKSGDSPGTAKALQFVPALVAACGVSALLAHGVLALSALALVPEAHHVAFMRTLTVSFISLCLAFSGSRWGLAAMTKLAYVALAFVAAKLLFEDLRHGHMTFIAGSIFLFAVTLIAVPRLVRWGARSRTAHDQDVLPLARAD